jgi:hypothetical protein
VAHFLGICRSCCVAFGRPRSAKVASTYHTDKGEVLIRLFLIASKFLPRSSLCLPVSLSRLVGELNSGKFAGLCCVSRGLPQG